MVFAGVVVAGFALLAYWISKDVSDRYSESFEEIMVDTANLLAEVITTDMNHGQNALLRLDDAFRRLRLRRFSAQIYSLEKTSADIEVYVTDDKGMVIFDSDGGKAVGEDYSQWRDVYRTLKGEYGARATRVVDESTGDDAAGQLTIAYVAAPIYQQGRIVGVVTVAKPKNNIDRFVANARTNLLLAVLISVVLALVLGFMLYTWVSRPLQALADYAYSVSKGRRVDLPQLGNTEIGRVGEALENMRQALEDKQYVEHYVQSLTHELKSPLTAIHAAAELLTRDLPAEKRTEFANTILRETERLNHFASQLLQLAALEQRRKVENPERVSLGALLSDIVQAHDLECKARELRVVFHDSAKDCVSGDPFLLRQALDNLFRNAIEFSPDEGTISIDIQPHEAEVAVDIRDEGPGIGDNVRDRIFERFFSLPRPDTGQKSTGLGLNFAREVAALHGGSLALDNARPGARARLVLPACA